MFNSAIIRRMSGDACIVRRIGFGVRPTDNFNDIVKTPPEPCVLRQHVDTVYSESVISRGRAKPFGQCVPGGSNDTQSRSAFCSKSTTANR